MFDAPAKAKPRSAAEIMQDNVLALLKRAGLEPVLEAANTLATSGAVQKILEFSEQVGPIRDQLDRIERRQLALFAAAGLADPCGADGRPGPAGGPAEPVATLHPTPRLAGSAGPAGGVSDP
jgi:hypothetical protein